MQDLLVASLFKDVRLLVLGAVTTTIAIAVTALRTGSLLLWACAGLFVAATAARLVFVQAYHRRPAGVGAVDDRGAWERGYDIGAAIHCLMIGLWCFTCLTFENDPFTELLSAVVTVGCASAIPGRNVGRVGIATLQTLCLCAPLCLGWMLEGDPWHAALAVLSLPFFASLGMMSNRLQVTLLDALTANNKLGTLAERFDAALSNMPIGICMLDQHGRVQVCNARFLEDLALGHDSDLIDLPLPPLLPGVVRRSEAGLPEPASLPVEALLRARTGGNVAIELRDGRTVELTLQPMPTGGAVVLAEDVTQRRRTETHITRLARFDAVTEIANRSYFIELAGERIAAARTTGACCALLFVDLDRFKAVNDTLGHGSGDLLLREVGRRIGRLLGPADVVGRFGGDEFVVLQSALRHADEAGALAAAIVAAMGRPFPIAGEAVRIAASVGVAVSAAGDADCDAMLQQADMALYRAKAAGRDRWTLFEPGMDAAALQRRMLEMELASAIDTWAFELHYQPLFNLDEMRISTCEALLRWRHPKHGLIPPAQFIPIAEETGLIGELGARVLRIACEECQGWPAAMNVAVNLSPVQFQRGDVVAIIADALARSGLAPHRLEVEITESVLLQNAVETRDALQRIRDMGVGVVLDDFGTGHASLAYLHNFPLRKVKLDRSFLAHGDGGHRSQVLLDGVCGLSHKLGLTVVVEGVETEAQLALVRGLEGVDEVQGYLIGRPIPRREIGMLLRRPEAEHRRAGPSPLVSAA